MKINHKSNGITLISLVVTIIVLLILSVISINAVVGENGIIERAKESRILSILADILFNLESNIIDINTDNILNDKKMISTEMLAELINRGAIEKKDDYTGFWSFSEPIQYKISGTSTEEFLVSYNGDVWLDNYKRGKIQLTTNVNTEYTQNAQTKITVIDGTVEEMEENELYCLHALEGRKDFVCWVNQYGEIISYFSDTMIEVGNRKDIEYTAIYNHDWRLDGSFRKRLIGIDSDAFMSDGEITFDLGITYLIGSCATLECRDESLDDYDAFLNYGFGITGVCMVVSPNYQDLIGSSEQIFSKSSNAKILWLIYNRDYKDVLKAVGDYSEANAEELTPLDNAYSDEFHFKGVSLDGDSGLNVPVFEYEDLGYFSARLSINQKENWADIIEDFGEEYESLDRLYYRCCVSVVYLIYGYNEEEGAIELYYCDADNAPYWTEDVWESVIKYVDV